MIIFYSDNNRDLHCDSHLGNIEICVLTFSLDVRFKLKILLKERLWLDFICWCSFYSFLSSPHIPSMSALQVSSFSRSCRCLRVVLEKRRLKLQYLLHEYVENAKGNQRASRFFDKQDTVPVIDTCVNDFSVPGSCASPENKDKYLKSMFDSYRFRVNLRNIDSRKYVAHLD